MEPFSMTAAALGALGTIGGMITNRSNRSMAREQMAFQERMSSTAAQRSVADYQAAGLNPALAYQNVASSPGGSSAQMGDAVASGINSAQSARLAASQIQLAQQQAEKANVEKVATAHTAVANNWKTIAEARAVEQGTRFQAALQPSTQKAAEIQALMASYGISKAEAESRYYKTMGTLSPAIRDLAGPAAGLAGSAALLRGVTGLSSSAKSAKSLFPAPRPRKSGDWERVNRNRGDLRPRGIDP